MLEKAPTTADFSLPSSLPPPTSEIVTDKIPHLPDKCQLKPTTPSEKKRLPSMGGARIFAGTALKALMPLLLQSLLLQSLLLRRWPNISPPLVNCRSWCSIGGNNNYLCSLFTVSDLPPRSCHGSYNYSVTKKHQTLSQCRYNAGPQSQTVDQQ